MMPYVSPKSSLKPGPTTPCGSVPRGFADVLAHLVPDVRHLLRRRRVLELDEHGGAARRRVAPHLVEMARLLQLAFDPLGDLEQRLLDRRAGPAREDDHGPDREGGVLGPAEAEKRDRPRHDCREHEVDDQRLALDRPLRQVRADHFAAPSRRTFWPEWRAWTPAVTTRSPCSRPPATTTRFASWPATSICLIDTVLGLGIHDPYRGLRALTHQRRPRDLHRGGSLDAHAAGHRRSEP